MSARALGRLLAIALAAALFSAVLVVPAVAAPNSGVAGPTRLEGLEAAQLRAETEKLKIEADNASGVRGWISELAGPLTGLAAIGTIIFSFLTFWRERKRERALSRESERQQLETRFAGVLISLGADSEAVRAGAAVSLLTFVEKDNGLFRKEAALAALANLKVAHPPMIKKLLQRALEKAMRDGGALARADLDFTYADLTNASLPELDLEGARLDYADLSGADLSGSRLATANGVEVRLDKARLSGAGASLFGARLPKATARRTNFSGADLVNAHLRNGDFQEASFRGARLQAAHLEGCSLQGAAFNGANVADTYFFGATLDQRSLRSLRDAVNADKAHFDPEVKARLRELSEKPEETGGS